MTIANDYLKIYTDFLKKFLKPEKNLTVVFDCSNGVTGQILKKLFLTQKLVNSQIINQRPDGRFPAHGPDPMKPGAMDDLCQTVRKYKADLGVIFDADGDRVFFVDDRGRPVHSDVVAGLLSKNFNGQVILDVRAGYLAREMIVADLPRQGGGKKKIVNSRVGHYFIKKLMREKKIPFAAEVSGHYYFQDFFFADSGIFAAIMMINSISRLNRPLSDWLDSLPRYYRSGEINFKVKDKVGVMKKVEAHFSSEGGSASGGKKLGAKISHIDGLRVEFYRRSPELAEGWFSLRPSNTEDWLRLNLEAKNKKVFDAELRLLEKLIKTPLS